MNEVNIQKSMEATRAYRMLYREELCMLCSATTGTIRARR
jgi:hypothetical protein